LNPQNRLKDLIAKSAAQKEIAGGKFAVHLGNRIQHVETLNEKTVCGLSLNVGWTNRFGEINDILSASICMACKGQG
jgi:hypothetical protein